MSLRNSSDNYQLQQWLKTVECKLNGLCLSWVLLDETSTPLNTSITGIDSHLLNHPQVQQEITVTLESHPSTDSIDETVPDLRDWKSLTINNHSLNGKLIRLSLLQSQSHKFVAMLFDEIAPLVDSPSLYASIIDSSEDAIISKTLDGKIMSWNHGAEKIFGFCAKEMVGTSIMSLFPEDRINEETDLIAKIASGIKVNHFRSIRRTKSGRTVCVSISLSPIYGPNGLVIGASKIARDITKEVVAEREINRFKSLVESSEDAIVCISLNGYIQSWNSAAENLLGYSAEQAIDQHFSMVTLPEDADRTSTITNSILNEEAIKHERVQLLSRHGATVHASMSISTLTLSDGFIQGIALIIRDISHELEQDEKIRQLAINDPLTGCFNRNGFSQRITSRLTQVALDNASGALLFIDLDNFKPINDNFGHDFGDKLLVEAVHKIQQCLRYTDILARFGGDEFVVYLDNIVYKQDIAEKAKEIIDSLNTVTTLDGNEVRIYASIGISQCPADGLSASALIKKADQAMYRAKAKGKNQFQFFSLTPVPTSLSAPTLSKELKAAIDEELICIYLQPIISNKDQVFCKAEALARWHHPTYGWVPPDEFIPIAEQYGLITALGKLILKQSVLFLAENSAKLGPDFQISINRSALEFYDEDNLAFTLNTIQSSGLDGSRFIFEITENMLMTHSSASEAILKAFRKAGIQIAIDDFGTGYSSLAYLKRIPADFLKIDKEFIKTLEVNTTDHKLCQGIVDIAHKLNLQVVAEGIENVTQKNLLSNMNCEFSQGYFFSKPLNKDDFLTFIQSNYRRR